MKRAWLIVAALAVSVIATVLAMTRTVPEPRIATQDPASGKPPGATVEVTYVANEGVLIAAGSTQVLIDGLHRQYRAAYPFLPEPYRERIETAQPPFDDVDLILVSHMHLDHFHPDAIVRHLQHNATAALVSSQQVVGEIEKAADFTSVRSRVTTITPPLKGRVSTLVGGISVELLGVGHGAGRHATIQNLAHIVSIGGKKLLHVGDASTEDASIFAAFRLAEANIDVAFLPAWFLTSDDGAAIVRQHIRPRQIAAVHMAAGDPRNAVAEIRVRFPEAAAFTTLLEKKYY
jgi:L-ascorbate metabolism protein UlaG (beta-lactamase superfamily)